MRSLNTEQMHWHYGYGLTFIKTGKNKYTVINKQGIAVGTTTGQSRYWYLKSFDLL